MNGGVVGLVLAVMGFAIVVVGAVLHAGHGDQAAADRCAARGGILVQTVKFSNGTVCIDRHAIVRPSR